MIARARSPLPWLGGLLALYLLAPIVAFLLRLRHGVSPSPGVGSALGTSLLTATIATVVIALLGTPLAYLLARGKGLRSRVLTALVALPLALPPLMSGLLLLYVLGPHTTLGRLFDGKLTETRLAIVLAQTFVAAPFLVIAARSAFASVDPALEDVAASLGHGRLARFWRVAVPAALPGIGAGLLLAWLRSFGEFGATVVLAYHPYSLPVYTFVEFDATGLPATMLPIAVALGAALAVLLLSGSRRSWRRRTQRSPPAPLAPRGNHHETAEPDVFDFALAKRLGDFSLDVTYRSLSPRLALLGPSGAGKNAHAAPARRVDEVRRHRARACRARIERATRPAARAARAWLRPAAARPDAAARRVAAGDVRGPRTARARCLVDRAAGTLRTRGALPRRAVRRPAAPRRARPRARRRTARAAARRAIRRARRACARPPAARAAPAATRGRTEHRARHARPRGGRAARR
ncbi:MAG TPA: ABC transporter permease subunit [Solirubrobacteraceae bacterium]|nr:ABC transporter permease subunit [Solirubrobacteraceae bacterium]